MSEGSSTTLVLAPHVDDEVLGCFSFLGRSTQVLYFGVEDRPSIPRTQRIVELKRVAAVLGFRWEVLEHPVNRYNVAELIPNIEAWIDRIKPRMLLVCEQSYNQDHRAVYDAALVATRPHDINWFVPNVLLYEQPHSVIYPSRSAVGPTYLRAIDIGAKLAAYRLYESQVREHRSPEIIEALARVRGAQMCQCSAEAFYVKRMVHEDTGSTTDGVR